MGDFEIYRNERDGTFDEIVIRRNGYVDYKIPIIGRRDTLDVDRAFDKQQFDVISQALNRMTTLREAYRGQ